MFVVHRIRCRTFVTNCVSMNQITHQYLSSIEAIFRILQFLASGDIYFPTYPKYQNYAKKKERVDDEAQEKFRLYV